MEHVIFGAYEVYQAIETARKAIEPTDGEQPTQTYVWLEQLRNQTAVEMIEAMRNNVGPQPVAWWWRLEQLHQLTGLHEIAILEALTAGDFGEDEDWVRAMNAQTNADLANFINTYA